MKTAEHRLRIVVLGYLVRGPMGGMVTSNLQYLMGLRGLGHDVFFVEDSDDFASCYNPVTYEMSTDPSYGLRFAADVLGRIGLGERWAYYDAHTARWLGPCADRIFGICASADLVLNLCGVNPLRPWLMEIPCRALVDEDPAFTQIKHLTDPRAREMALRHTVFFSFGENIASGRSAVPDDGLPWQPTRPPVALDAWPEMPVPAGGKFTTVMQWDSYPAREYGGRRFGMKSDSFRPYLDLPERAGPTLELAAGGVPAEERRTLARRGWALRDPGALSRDPWTYQRYIQGSRAEFSVAKHGYVVSRSGWFSERSACYLATGRPVAVEDTGFSDCLPTGSGVLAFRTPDEALAGIAEINRRYDHHCRAAREMAEAYFDARGVLAELLERSLR